MNSTPIKKRVLEAKENYDWTSKALQAAVLCARRRGLNGDEATDCAMEFLAHLFQRSLQYGQQFSISMTSQAWIFRCASNYVSDYLRSQRRRYHWESCHLADFEDYPDHSNRLNQSCEILIMRSWSMAQISLAIDRLSPLQKKAFTGYYISAVPIPELATALSVAPHALEQTLFRARLRLRQLLMDDGITGDELRHLFRQN